MELDRPSVAAALADYLLQANYRGYRPDGRKVLAVRRSDRTASLRNAGTPVRWEVAYFIEGELFPEPGMTRLEAGETHLQGAERLLEGVWELLWAWNGYDFTPTSYGLGRGRYSDDPAGWGSAHA
jgi:hypothetical protein